MYSDILALPEVDQDRSRLWLVNAIKKNYFGILKV